jgi:hypothetical protein
VGVKVTAEPDVPVSLRDGLGKVLRRRLAPLNLASAHMTLTESHDGLPMVLIETYFAGGLSSRHLSALRLFARGWIRTANCWARRRLTGLV